jgi:hypothetical protein
MIDLMMGIYNKTPERGKFKMSESTFHSLYLEIRSLMPLYSTGSMLEPRPKFMGVPIWFDNDIPDGEVRLLPR